MLPPVESVKLQEPVFPAPWQTALFRNYGYVPAARLAAALQCTEKDVAREAARMGLKELSCDGRWTEKGYITLIRNNWYLLDYDQMCVLLGCDERRLDFLLKEEDFLSVKLGGFKPRCEGVRYYPLGEEEKRKTARLAEAAKDFLAGRGKYFDFFTEFSSLPAAEARGEGARVVHGYLTPCGNAFAADAADYLPDALLAAYARTGVNGLWMHGVLSSLSPYPFKPALSANYRENREKLKALIRRAARFGVRIYLYFNEPRCLDIASFSDLSLAGQRQGEYAALCSSRGETEKYLYDAVYDLVKEIPDLGGIITITMSENLTHCNSQQTRNCPRCKNIPAEELASRVNNVIARAVRESGAKTEVIANLWGWSPLMGWSEAQTLRGVDLLDKDVSVMCVSEYGLRLNKGGVEIELSEYSVADIGPSAIARAALARAAEKGHKIYAKIQANNSWECSCVPYLPVFDTVYEHLKNLSEIGVKDYMLSWTLGGYPSVTLSLVRDFAEKGENFSLPRWYAETFGKESERVRAAVKEFCAAFKAYPISLGTLYYSPKNLGAANLWSLQPEEKHSAMVGFSFDDYERWIDPYPYEVYLAQYEKLLRGWEKGLSLLESAENGEETRRLARYARAAYLHFKTDALQTEFSFYKKDVKKNAEKLLAIVGEEEEIVLSLAALQRQDPYIGFEASNHYFYTDRNLAEKYLQMRAMKETLRHFAAENALSAR